MYVYTSYISYAGKLCQYTSRLQIINLPSKCGKCSLRDSRIKNFLGEYKAPDLPRGLTSLRLYQFHFPNNRTLSTVSHFLPGVTRSLIWGKYPYIYAPPDEFLFKSNSSIWKEIRRAKHEHINIHTLINVLVGPAVVV